MLGWKVSGFPFPVSCLVHWWGLGWIFFYSHSLKRKLQGWFLDWPFESILHCPLMMSFYLFIYLQSCMRMDKIGRSFLVPSCSGFSLSKLSRSITKLLNSTELFWSCFWDCNVVLNVIWRRRVNLREVYMIALNKVIS